MRDWEDTRDGAERRYPSHLDTILDPEPGEWWADIYGLARPPETFSPQTGQDRERDAPPQPVGGAGGASTAGIHPRHRSWRYR